MSVIESLFPETRVSPPPAGVVARAEISGMDAYRSLVDEAERDYEGFWGRLARETLTWKKPFSTVLDETNAPFYKWYEDGELNASYNCLDRHIEAGNGERIAFHWRGEEGEERDVNYADLHRDVQRFANAL